MERRGRQCMKSEDSLSQGQKAKELAEKRFDEVEVTAG